MRETVDSARGEQNFLLRDRSTSSTEVPEVARSVDAHFPVKYMPSGFMDGGEFFVPVYESGEYVGQPKDRYVVRADEHPLFGDEVLGTHSGKYPERAGYVHVYETLEALFPRKCSNVTMFGNGERVVVEQILDKPFDLGNGDEIQPFIYTRMSLNGVWKTEIIPVQKRISCENMLGSGKGIVSVRATKNHDDILTMKSRVLEVSMRQAETVRKMARILSDQEFSDWQFQALVKTIVPKLPSDAPERAVVNRNKKIAVMNNAWRDETEKWGTMNKWLAYNAVQGAEQHQINANYKIGETVNFEKSLAKSLDGKTPLAKKALEYLS